MTQVIPFSATDRLDGRVAVIAGGAGAIGLATARRLAARGARCVLLHHQQEAVVQAQLADLPGSGHGQLTASITDSASLRAAAEAVASRYGRCDILVNSAGATRPVPAADLEGLTDELIDDMLN